MISIVMTCHNRRVQLINTLNSIAYFRGDTDIEVILVDDTDREEERIEDLPERYNFPVHLIRVDNKDWVCSCVAYNMGFDKISGTTVIIQNAECMWMGNILKYVKDNSRSGLYITFGAYSPDRPYGEINFKAYKDRLYKDVVTSEYTFPRGRRGWFNHSRFRPAKFHFCSAISRSDLERLNGFDERYADGFAHDDAEILVRIDNAGIESVIVDEPFVIHQWHENQGSAMSNPLWQKNYHLYQTKTLQENLVKAPQNKIYVR